MRYPNIRYGNPAALDYYAMGIPLDILARRLRRDERTVRDWLKGNAKIPWWVPEILRLQNMEAADIHRQMCGAMADYKRDIRLGVVRENNVLELQKAKPKPPPAFAEPAETDLRREDFVTKTG